MADALPGNRIMVVGASGAGKSHTARRLATLLGVPYISNDAIIWRANWQLTPKDERFVEFEIATRANAWTFDGNRGGRMDAEDLMILGRADTLVWIDLPRLDIMRQLLLRTLHRAWTRQELWHGTTETWRQSFASRDSILLWSWSTYAELRHRHARMFCDPRCSHLRKIRLTSRAAVDRWVARIAPSSPV